ncbi:4Fe-4S binding protein [Azospirillum sp. sgz302134]
MVLNASLPDHPIGNRHPGALPTIAAERCVHNKALVASCRGCADACPRGAWIVDEDGVSLDAQSCDGCGLCAPACPQSVISHGHRAARRLEAGRPVAFAACSQTGLRNGQDGNGRDGVEGVLPCLNVLSLSDLAALYRDGVRRMVIARGTCAACPTGSSTAVRLERAVEELNALLDGRGLPPLVLTRRSATPWRAYLTFDTVPDEITGGTEAESPNAVSRRGLFRLSSRRPTVPVAAVEAQADSIRPPGRLLPEPAAARLADTQPWPWVPSIDSSVCEGCGSCARLCPTGAIRLTEDPPAFRIIAEDCTGCRLCVDVCRPGALILERLAPRRQIIVALHPRRCPSCGVTTRLPEARPKTQPNTQPNTHLGADGLCPVCRRTSHNRRLFQVIE